MGIEKIKEELNPDDIESLVHWQQYMYSYFPKEDEDEFEFEEVEEFLELYDFIMDKIAWQYINKIKSN